MTTYYISTSGNNAAAGTSSGTAWKTIQYAVNNASSGDIIRVLPGTHWRFDVVSKTNLTIMADDSNDRPYIQSYYHDIPDSSYATGAGQPAGNALEAACVYIDNSNGITIDGLRFENERSPAFGVTASVNMTDLTIRNCLLEDIWPSLHPTRESGKTRSPVWVQGRNGGQIRKILFEDNTLIRCNPRSDDGRGTEVITFTGNLRSIVVRGCFWKDCQAINLNFLGNINMPGQPTYILVEDCVFWDAYLLRNGVPATTTSIYFDRGTGPALIRNCISYNPNTQAAGIKLNWEDGSPGWGLPLPTQNVIAQDNVLVSQRWPVQIGQEPGVTGKDVRPLVDCVMAHNVMIVTTGGANGGTMLTRNGSGFRFYNNVLASFGQHSNDKTIQSQADNPSSWKERGNVLYSIKNAPVQRGGSQMSPAQFVANIQAGTGSVGQPRFEHGRTTFPASGNYTGLDLADWVLTSNSPGYKDAEPLTYANGNGNSSNELQVDDARFFFPGISEMGTDGHEIVVGGTDATVIGVNYQANTLTLKTAVSWSDNAPIYYKPETSGVYSAGITSQASADVSPNPDPDPDPIITSQMLVNPRFDDGTSGWQFSEGDGSGTFSVADGRATIDVGVDDSGVQLYQFGLSVISGEEVEFVMWASSSTSQSVTVNLRLHSSPYSIIGLNETFQLTPSCAKYSKTFTVSSTADNARLQILISGEGTLQIEDTSLGALGAAVGGCEAGDTGGGTSGEQTEQSLSVAIGSDDGVTTSGMFYDVAGNNIALGEKSGTLYIGGFGMATTADISQYDVVMSASFGFCAGLSDPSAVGYPTLRIRAALTSAFPANQTAWQALTFTTSFVEYTPADWNSNDYHEVDISTVIQELVNAGDVDAGSFLVIQMSQETALGGGTNNQRYARAWDYNSGEKAASLSLITMTPQTETGERVFVETFSETFAETWSVL